MKAFLKTVIILLIALFIYAQLTVDTLTPGGLADRSHTWMCRKTSKTEAQFVQCDASMKRAR